MHKDTKKSNQMVTYYLRNYRQLLTIRVNEKPPPIRVRAFRRKGVFSSVVYRYTFKGD